MATLQTKITGKAHAEKYHSSNPIARRLVGGFLASLQELARKTGARDIHEIGCGEGHVLATLAGAGISLRGTDISPESLSVAGQELGQAGIHAALKLQDLYTLDPEKDAAELVVCCEVLEHVDDPEKAFSLLAKLAKSWLIVSVPREPIWCMMNVARGKYLSSMGNTPGHLNHWSKSGFVRMASRYAEVIEIRSPLPWTMILCRTGK